MNKKTWMVCGLFCLSLTMQAQTKGGGIDTKMMQKITTGHNSAANRAISNAIATNSIDNLAKNFRNSGAIDTHFSVETPKQNIHDQKSSGRCWLFSGLNVLRSNFAHRHNDSLRVELSHVYLSFHDQLEKSNLMLQGVIDNAAKPMTDPIVQFFFKSPIGDGGTFCGVSDLVDKYGLVPMEVMPETYSAENTSRMARIVSSKLREFGLELRKMVANKKSAAAIKSRKTEMLGEIYNILVLSLGEPVKTFEYAFKDKNGRQVGKPKTYTPQTFRDEVVGRKLSGTFIMAMNDPRREYYKTYEVEYDRHTYDGQNWKYINLPMDDIAKMAIASLKDSTKMYSSYDVGKQLDRKRGYLDLNNYDYGTLFGTTFPMNKADRIATFDSGSTHAMTLTAVDLDESGNPIKWKVENSWGPTNGQNGCLIMTNDWFNEYSFRLVVDKKYVPAHILKAEQQTPIMVMPDDPLFQEDK
ncbi:C1 family peptidase [Prevotella brunnea]|uniref:Aminopeptidase n=1 Tax=Prevotella brunnea TaxID=2508867 RepID=A0A5C8GLP7_9BACT|nr:C1 family peptidase [Prevotella brunnea]MDR0185489.1 C1 family peptidase [Prevotella brunnea]TXJ63037.1 C1 family peptidase [Prevotella brunnea]